MAQNISYTEYRKSIMKSVKETITVYPYSPEGWKARTVYLSSTIDDIVYVHERGQKKPSAVVFPTDWAKRVDTLKELFKIAKLGGGYITVTVDGKDYPVSYEAVQKLEARELATV